MLNHSNRQSQD